MSHFRFTSILFTFLLGFLALSQTTHALLVEGGSRRFGIDHGSQPLGEVGFTMNNQENPITAAQGIRLILPASQWVLWEKDVPTLDASGTAVEKNRIGSSITVSYSDDLKVLHIPVLQDWQVGDEMTLTGLMVRIYDRASGPQAIGVDITGDSVKDYDSLTTIRIDDTDRRTDRLSPYSPRNAVASVLAGPWRVELTWQAPMDYDFNTFDLERILTRVGETKKTALLSTTGLTSYTDRDVLEGDKIAYQFYAMDKHLNRSVAVSVTVAVKAGPTEDMENPEDPELDLPEDPDADEGISAEEEAFLKSRLNYYSIRYEIKCGTVTNPLDSACLWAKINLNYALTRLNVSIGEDNPPAFSDREMAVIVGRLKYSYDRYDQNCVLADTIAPYCKNLQRDINQASYLFIYD